MDKWFIKSKTVWINGLIAAFAFMQTGIQPDQIEQITNSASGTELGLIAAPLAHLLLRFKTNESVGSDGKSVFSSWNIWLSVGLIVLALYMMWQGNSTTTVIGLLVVGIVNLFLRFITNSGVNIFPRFR